MKKFIGVLMAGFVATSALAADIKLPAPEKTNTTTLVQALENRHSDHEFSNKAVDNQTLSNLLWAAYGVNREDGKRTIPTAMNKKELNIDKTKKTLKKWMKEDFGEFNI